MFYYAVGRGNYPNQIIDALQSRGNWEQVSEDTAIETADFYWRPINFGAEGYFRLNKRLIEKPKFIFNHFEVLNLICTKTNLIRSLRVYYENNEAAKLAGYTIFDSTPTTYVISRSSEIDINLFLKRYREIASGGSRNERTP
jgi:hypothetical protein